MEILDSPRVRNASFALAGAGLGLAALFRSRVAFVAGVGAGLVGQVSRHIILTRDEQWTATLPARDLSRNWPDRREVVRSWDEKISCFVDANPPETVMVPLGDPNGGDSTLRCSKSDDGTMTITLADDPAGIPIARWFLRSFISGIQHHPPAEGVVICYTPDQPKCIKFSTFVHELAWSAPWNVALVEAVVELGLGALLFRVHRPIACATLALGTVSGLWVALCTVKKRRAEKWLFDMNFPADERAEWQLTDEAAVASALYDFDGRKTLLAGIKQFSQYILDNPGGTYEMPMTLWGEQYDLKFTQSDDEKSIVADCTGMPRSKSAVIAQTITGYGGRHYTVEAMESGYKVSRAKEHGVWSK